MKAVYLPATAGVRAVAVMVLLLLLLLVEEDITSTSPIALVAQQWMECCWVAATMDGGGTALQDKAVPWCPASCSLCPEGM